MAKKKLRTKIKEQNAKIDSKYVKGKYYYMDYASLPHKEQREELDKGMKAGGIRIVLGVALIMICIIILVIMAQRI